MSGRELIQAISKRKIRIIICLITSITLSVIFINDHSRTYGQDYSKTDLDEINRYIARNPNDTYALIDRGLIYHDNGKYDKAIADFSKAIHLDPYNLNAYYFRGMTYGRIRESEQAIRDFRSAIDIDPYFVDAYRMMGLTYYEMRQYDHALELYDYALELAPDDPLLYLYKGDVLFMLREYERAFTDYSKAIQYDSYYPAAYCARGNVSLYLENYNEAIEDCNRAIELDSNYAFAYFVRGNAYLEKKDFSKADYNYRIATILDPELSPPMIDPDYIQDDQQIHRDEESEDEDTISLFGENPFEDEPYGDDNYGFDEMDTTQWFTDLEETPAGNYSEDQIEIVNRLGPPESFTIMICSLDEESDEVVRTDTWNYYSMQSRFVFTDGKLVLTEEIEAIDGNAVFPEYTPDRFVYGMSFKEVIDFLGEMEFALAEITDEYVENGDLYFTEQLVLGFKDDMLFYVESLPLIPEEDED
jgi:tetratricopeptide (TPR) repeat protein